MRYTAINDNKDLCKLQALFSNGQYTGNIYPQNNDYFSSMENLESILIIVVLLNVCYKLHN